MAAYYYDGLKKKSTIPVEYYKFVARKVVHNKKLINFDAKILNRFRGFRTYY